MSKARAILVFVFSLLAAVAVILTLIERISWDASFKKVLLVFDGDEFSRLEAEGLFLDLPSPSAISVSEVTVGSLKDRGYLFRVSDTAGGRIYQFILKRELLFEEPIARMSGKQEKENAPLGNSEISSALKEIIKRSIAYQLVGGFEIEVEVVRDHIIASFRFPVIPEEQENKLALGFYLRPEIVYPKAFGYVFRPSGNGLFTEDSVKEKLSLIPRVKERIPLIIFQGDQILGYPNALTATARSLPGAVGIPEFTKLDGLDTFIGALTPEKLFWVHTIPTEEMGRMSQEEMIARFVRALRERNPRVIYVHPLTGNLAVEPKGALSDSLHFSQDRFVSELKRHITEKLGYVPTLELSNPKQSRLFWAKPIMLMAGYLVFCLALMLYFPGSRTVAFFNHPLTLVIFFFLLFIACSTSFASKLLTVTAGIFIAILSPLIGLNLGLDYLERTSRVQNSSGKLFSLAKALVAFGLVFLASILGGLLVFSLYHSLSTFVKAEVFHGVIISRLLPALLALVYCYSLSTLLGPTRQKSFLARINSFLGSSVNYLDFVLILVLLAGLALAVLRAGNEFGFLVAQPERVFRSTLENLIGVRPRNTEILGHFLLIWFFILLRTEHRSILLLLAGGMLGSSSVVNTFTHFHTPILVSFLRVTTGLLLSLIALVITYSVYLLLRHILKSVIHSGHNPGNSHE